MVSPVNVWMLTGLLSLGTLTVAAQEPSASAASSGSPAEAVQAVSAPAELSEPPAAAVQPPAEAMLTPLFPTRRSALALGGQNTYGLLYAGKVDPGKAGGGVWMRLQIPSSGHDHAFRLGFGSSVLGWQSTLSAELPLLTHQKGRLSASLGPELTLGVVLARPQLLPVVGLGASGRLALSLVGRWNLELSVSPALTLCPGYQSLGELGYVGIDTPILLGLSRKFG